MRFLTTTKNQWLNLLNCSTVKAFPGVNKTYSLLFYELNPAGNYRYGHRQYFDTAEELEEFLNNWLRKK